LVGGENCAEMLPPLFCDARERERVSTIFCNYIRNWDGWVINKLIS
jgi:hypothetical protein